ncbi:hypothetical protein CO614_06140 [Lysobacteraceae bacterium NML120232]|nr:hypothetical protein CO614_06140 [Xanthomonadaceae bacterium NML120232]
MNYWGVHVSKAEIRTVLLARPGDARDQLAAVLEKVGLELALVADPLEIEQAQVLALHPHNLVIALDAEVEEALDRFDDLLALPDCQILFEESSLVAARVGWDIARWSRHLSAKLLGHGDVLPAGHETDEPIAARPSPGAAAAPVRPAAEAASPVQAAPVVEPVAEPVRPLQAELSPAVEASSVPLQTANSAIEVATAVEPPIAQRVEAEPQQAEAVPTAAAQTQAAASDYNDYDDLDAFSFLDEGAIEAAMARDAEAEAIRKAEAEAEAARLAEAFAEIGFDTQTSSHAEAIAKLDAEAGFDLQPLTQAAAAPVAEAPLLDDYATLDALSSADTQPSEPILEVAPVAEAPLLDDYAMLDALSSADTQPSEPTLEVAPVAEAPLLDDYGALDSLSFLDEAAIEAATTRDAEAEAIAAAEAAAEAALRAETQAEEDASSLIAPAALRADDNLAAETEPLLESIDLGGWQIPAELEAAASTALDAQLEQRGLEDASEHLAADAKSSLDGEFGQWDLSGLGMETVEPAADAAEAPAPAAADWSVYQDFDAISELPIPDVAAVENFDSGYREALAPVEPSDLAPEEAYQRVEDDLKQFDTPVVNDGWQDFEKPTLAPVAEQQKPADTAAQAPDAQKSRVEKLFESVSQWSLSEITLTIDEGSKRPAFERKTDEESQSSAEPELRFSSPSIAEMTGAKVPTQAEPVAVPQVAQQEGAVLLLGGIGGPDPLRQILQNLPPVFPVPILVQQWLDGGHYDRLQRQMERVSQMPVMLAQPGMYAEHGKVYIVSPGIRLLADSSSQLRFVAAEGRDFANLLEAMPGNSSVAVLLSGASEAFVDPLLRFQQAGGKLLSQSAEGCYDHTMPALMASRGAKIDSPIGIATQLKALWQSAELK